MEEVSSDKSRVTWDTICSFNTDYHVDTIEFSPNRRLALCGGYELNEKTNERIGQLLVFSSMNGPSFHLSTKLNCSGLLDISWMDEFTALGAQADGEAALWHFEENTITADSARTHKISSSILLSTQTSHTKIFFSDSAGCVHLWTVQNGSELTQLKSHQAHEYEAWCVTGDTICENLYYTGGDDGFCYAWDERCGSKPTMRFKHDVGVCSVVSQPLAANVISTGCYDGFLRLWDLRMSTERGQGSRNPILLVCSTGGGGGGVWRHKWLNKHYVLMAAMHSGFVVVGPVFTSQFDESAKILEPLACYRSTAKLAYGIDCYEQDRTDSTNDSQLQAIVGTCSFYDNTVDFSRLTLPGI